ncbi:MAG: glycogen synthase GlgA [Ruminococcaceae bacterium]|nr:glycogen synthase GlgA [Oscillospiraceae bacterium]
MKKILHVASEATPFASAGGLGDVIGSLPKALKARYGEDADIRVIMPLYGSIDYKYKEMMNEVYVTSIPLAWRWQYCGLYSIETEGVIYYFVDNEYYFKRPTLYGSFDDAERYAFFCKAVLTLMQELNYFPDVLHAHDWHAALSVIYLKQIYKNMPKYDKIKAVFTIHNVAYQGVYGFEILGDVFDLSPSEASIVEYNNCINLMKGAIVCADEVTTVSPTYAKELLSPSFSEGLHFILDLYKDKMSGILNGLDYDYYNPETDESIFRNYTWRSVGRKKENKTALQEMLGLPVSKEVPMIAIISRLVAHKGIDIIQQAVENILSKDIQLVILGQGDYHYENFFKALAERYPTKVRTLLTYNKDLSKRIYAASDMFLMPSRFEPCGLSQMIASRYGTVPIIRETGGLYDTIKDVGNVGGGNGFTFAPYSPVQLADAVNRAYNYYCDSKAWQLLAKKVMKVDFSWNTTAGNYIDMYDRLTQK